MTNKEQINRNIGLTFDFVHHLINNPELIDTLPDKFKLEFIEKDFTKIEEIKKNKPVSDTIETKKYVKVRNEFEITG